MAGNELRKLRLIAGQTQYQLAQEAEVDRTRISLAENGHVKLTNEEAKKLTRAILAIVKRERTQVESKIAEVKTMAALYGASVPEETAA